MSTVGLAPELATRGERRDRRIGRTTGACCSSSGNVDSYGNARQRTPRSDQYVVTPDETLLTE